MKPLIVDKKTKRFWALIDKRGGTLWCSNVSSEIDHASESHDEVVLYTSAATAMRAAAAEQLDNDANVAPVEVIIVRAPSPAEPKEKS